MKTIKYGSYESIVLSTEEVNMVKDTLQSMSFRPEVKALITKDQGACIIGECLEVYVLPPRCKYPKIVKVYGNYWTQGDQPKALKKLKELFETEYPTFLGALKYNCGNMD